MVKEFAVAARANAAAGAGAAPLAVATAIVGGMAVAKASIVEAAAGSPTVAVAGAETLLAGALEPRGAVDGQVVCAWRALATVEDPEIPALYLVDLGIIRFIETRTDGKVEVGLSPTYTGCPATDVIRASVEEALRVAGIEHFVVSTVLAPAWTSDWITDEGRRKLHLYGIVPPESTTATMRDVLRGGRPVACPRCRSVDTESVSEFGSTPCKALHRCRACLEPFEYFKCI